MKEILNKLKIQIKKITTSIGTRFPSLRAASKSNATKFSGKEEKKTGKEDIFSRIIHRGMDDGGAGFYRNQRFRERRWILALTQHLWNPESKQCSHGECVSFRSLLKIQYKPLITLP